MAEYLYGTYGHLADSLVSSAADSPSAVVYIGTAPVNLIRGYATAGIINRPVKIRNLQEAQNLIGVSSDWDSFTLSEAVAAHFDNANGNIGPIYVINVLDPATHVKSAAVTASLTFTNGRAVIVSDKIILDTLVLDGKAEGTDYIVSYDMTGGKANIISKDPASPITGTVSATYNVVDPALVSKEQIIGQKTTGGVYTGMQAAELIYQTLGVIPNLYAAPKWSEDPDVYRALIAIATELCGHWDAFVYADMPIAQTTYAAVAEPGEANPKTSGWYEKASTGAYIPTQDTSAVSQKTYYTATVTAVDTIAKAVSWKSTNGYTNERTKIFWPQVKGSDGKIYHISTLALAETLRVDSNHDGIPFETCGNKAIPVVSQYFGASATNAGFTEDDSRDLTSKGITTAVFWAGAWKIWGDSTAAYTYGDTSVDARGYFDVTMRMLFYITNGFQTRWANSIDKPMTVQLKDTILVREQELLDGLVNRGALIGDPVIMFLPENNSNAELLQGQFRWDIQATPTLPLKSATAYVAYTDAGLSAYLG